MKKTILIILVCVALIVGIVLLVNRPAKHTHVWDGGVVTTEPSCIATGVKTFTCSGCGETRTKSLPITDHIWDDGTVTTPATCTVAGSKILTCKTCGETTPQEIPAPGHVLDDGILITPATCATNGEKDYICTICGETVIETIPATGHTWGDSTVTAIETCTNSGAKISTCITCGELRTEPIPALGHHYKSVVTTPTCTEQGFTTYTCSRCGDSYTGNFVSTADHSWDEGTVVTASTDELPGEKTFTCKLCGATKTEGMPANGHNYVAVVTPPTCTEEGYTNYTCKDCGSTYIDSIRPMSDHIWNNLIVTKKPTETERGIATFTCTLCGKTKTEVIPSVGKLYTRIDMDGIEASNGEYILFGRYPQSEVTDDDLKATLNAQIGEWIPYSYHIEGSICDYMYYQDVIVAGQTYRGVYFTDYRPYLTKCAANTGNSYQDDNGYTTDTVYWFHFEPIKWRILSEEDGTAFVFCESILDSQYYQDSYLSTEDIKIYYNNAPGVPDKVYAVNYEYSVIRAWLNEVFYETAFSDLQQALILTTTLDNSARSANPNDYATVWNNGKNPFASIDTQDKVFLLSEQEVTNSVYGFNSDYSNCDPAREKQPTDYAQIQGAFTVDEEDYNGNGLWWLRSSYCFNSLYVHIVHSSGYTYDYGYIAGTFYGIVPALQIRLN